MTFKKNEYLDDQDVICFIEYLSNMVKDNDPRPLNHSYKVDPVNKHFFDDQIGKPVHYRTIRQAFDGYAWNKQNYSTNKDILNEISQNLQVTPVIENNLYKACLDCLEWGAGGKKFKLYTANRDWLDDKKKETKLSILLEDSHNQLSNESPNLTGFKDNGYRMNSGFTKIYALKYPNFIIYDSRVAAALGLLVSRYCIDARLTEVPSNLAFRWSGTNKRKPSMGSLKFKKLNNNSKNHAEWNVKANWLLNAVVEKVASTVENKNSPFWGVSAHECLRALEAALFMVGYSLVPPSTSPTATNILLTSPADLNDSAEEVQNHNNSLIQHVTQDTELPEIIGANSDVFKRRAMDLHTQANMTQRKAI